MVYSMVYTKYNFLSVGLLMNSKHIIAIVPRRMLIQYTTGLAGPRQGFLGAQPASTMEGSTGPTELIIIAALLNYLHYGCVQLNFQK